ncbi:MAG: hypothetical protein RLZ25_2215 [Pseudomonadota bacterium]|jgi:hypothetical protein
MHPQPTKDRTRGVIIFYGVFILLLTVFAVSWRIYNAKHPAKTYQEQLIPQVVTNPVSGKGPIEVGLLINNIYNFEASQKTFDADGWVWLKWSQEIEQAMRKRHLQPQDIFYFFNQVNGFDALLIPANQVPKRTPNGGYYAKFQFSGHFFANQLDFRKFPFQTLKFPIALELRPMSYLGLDSTPEISIDYENSGLGAYVDIGGYKTKGFTLAPFTHVYESSLGDPDLGKEPRRVSQARLEISYEKAAVATVLKIVLPLLAVMALSLLSPSISAAGWDVRVGIPPTALLSLIFLQQTYQTWLPELPYITFLDTVYNVCYVANLVLFALFLWSTNSYSQCSDEERPAVVERIDKLDSFFQKGLLLVIIIAVTLNWNLMGVGH